MVDDETRGTRADPAAPTADGSIAAAGVAPTELPSDETMVPSWGASSFASLPDPGYQLGALIGKGGMGEVLVAQDQRIGREVAVKRIRSLEPSSDAVSRFLREARIQARLDHPAIVPVYELGSDADGRPYFTMKRLAGVTLAKRLTQEGPVQPLLRAFVDVCLAIQLAHSRGVVHRDLKPSNIMLGDYGEVYVLDWGVARVVTDTKRAQGTPSMEVSDDDGTTAGAILGTPGYMSPEQVRGIEAGIKADVYSLGAILFEILAGEPLHPRGEAALASTLTSPQEAPARRAAERKQIPPELDGVCFDALAEEPAARPSARELADRVQAYLDGDRDLERRRALANAQLRAAQDALASDDRATAMRRAGRALALDPESTEAASLVTSLLLEPPSPDKMPADLSETLAQEERTFSMSRSRQGMWAYLSLFIFWAAIPFMHVKSWTALVSFYALIALGAAVAWRNSLRGYSNHAVTLVMTMLVCLGFTRVSGPFILTPIVICAALMQLTSIRQLNMSLPIIVGWIVLAVMLPFVLEWTGLVDQTYAIRHGVVESSSEMFDMRGSFDETALVVGNLIFTVSAGLVAVYISRRRMQAQRAMQVQAWHLRQLLPNEKRWQTRPR